MNQSGPSTGIVYKRMPGTCRACPRQATARFALEDPLHHIHYEQRLSGSGGSGCLTVFKPHGCVRSLDEAREAFDNGDTKGARQRADRFLITAAELNAPPFDPQATQQHILWNLMTRLAACPLMTLGWSASEEYIHRLVEKGVRPVLKECPPKVDELSIIDTTFKNGHSRLPPLPMPTEHSASSFDSGRTVRLAASKSLLY